MMTLEDAESTALGGRHPGPYGLRVNKDDQKGDVVMRTVMLIRPVLSSGLSTSPGSCN